MNGVVNYDRANAERVDRQYMAPALASQRMRTLHAMALRSGQRVLDIGCGPGYLSAEIARQIGIEGRVVAMDTSRPMLEIARARCASLDQIGFCQANASALPFPTSSFDAAAAVQVYLFVRDIEHAIAELVRVLRPGGLAIVVDTDWDSLVWHSSDRARMDRLIEVWIERFVNARIARNLPGLLNRAGLIIEHTEAIPLVELNPGEISYSGSQIPELARYVVAKERISEEIARNWVADLQQLATRNEYFFSLNRYAFVTRKRS